MDERAGWMLVPASYELLNISLATLEVDRDHSHTLSDMWEPAARRSLSLYNDVDSSLHPPGPLFLPSLPSTTKTYREKHNKNCLAVANLLYLISQNGTMYQWRRHCSLTSQSTSSYDMTTHPHASIFSTSIDP